MVELHKLLKRQLKKHLGISEIPSGMEAFIHSVNDAYVQNDSDKMMIERSLEISSKELFDTIDQLKRAQLEILQSKEKMKHIAFHDALTGLPNRYMLYNEMHTILLELQSNMKSCAVLFIDLDDFKKVNDVYGHNIGDETLNLAVNRLCSCVRKKDRVYRYGGDEFLIIMMDIEMDEVLNIIRRMHKGFENPFEITNYEVFTTPSIGISFYPHDGGTVQELIKNADTAMYWAKERGKNNYVLFSKQIAEIQSRKLTLENDLRSAVRNREFVVHYQPQINMATGNLCGFEALVRWNHPALGLLMPGEFIQIAEETGYIVAIGELVLESVCLQNKDWIDRGIFEVPVAVNVSAVQLNHSDFTRMVQRHLDASGLSPEKLVVEFTESIMQDTIKSFQIVNLLKEMGVKVAIDDFGTGYSSLSIIKDLRIDILKIDAYFIKDIESNPNTLDIIKLIIDMGKKLNFYIIMEGIETEGQALTVAQIGCLYGQGYFFSRPQSVQDLDGSIYK